ncbi:hypothetical protein CW311_04550 [Acinetobacter proteolyticus]|uniref:Tail tube protein n=1 Tax=Acinetobacter proteolyticus TaxID=1776741 RepID=A0A2N0WIF3_9GAMM|nr:hypothetical protein CW311_04550 [Acinetobacter proteolyticus]
MLRNTIYKKTQVEPASKVTLDTAKKPDDATLDSAAHDVTFDAAASYELASIAQQAVSAIHSWVETGDEDLESGESMTDRLISLFVGIADSNKDGELDDDEQEVVEAALEAAWDYLASFGASDEDISALLNDWDDAAANAIIDLVATGLPEGEDAADLAIANFAFGDNDQDPVFDATYAKRMVVSKGKKVRINKRIGGTVRLSAKQKMAVRKMLKKSHNTKARASRLRSMKVRNNSSM